MLKISNKLSDSDRAYIQNIINAKSGAVRVNGKLPDNVTYELIYEKGFVVGVKRILRKTK